MILLKPMSYPKLSVKTHDILLKALKGEMNQNGDIFLFESNMFIKDKINVFQSFKQIELY